MSAPETGASSSGGFRVIFLTGFMGSGKSTLGRALGARPGWRYVDLDDFMEERHGMTVREMFGRHGEQWFRAEESRMLREAAEMGPASGAGVLVVGCGGGTPCHGDNMDWMNSRGLTVLLQASDEVLLRRLTEAQEQRPLLAGMDACALAEFIRTRQAERAGYYGRAAMRICSDRLESEEQIEDTVREFMEMAGENALNPDM